MVWKPEYPIKKIPHNLWKGFPEWMIKTDGPNALKEALETLDRINDWQKQMISDLVALHDWLEKERRESMGEIPVCASYVYKKQLVELFLGCSVKTAKRFLNETSETQVVFEGKKEVGS